MPRRGFTSLYVQNEGFLVLITVVFTYIQSSEAACPHPRFTLIPDHTACLPKSEYAKNSGLTAALRTFIVDRHNYHRARVNPPARNMLKMSWDDGLEEVAQVHADTCVYGHDTTHHRQIPGRYRVGQNLGLTAGAYDWKLIIDAWHSEVVYFQWETGSTNGSAVGHYTQLVWAESHKIGCGYAYCTNPIFESSNPAHNYVCNYAPGGNKYGQENTPYKNGTTCGDCPNSCRENLCDCSQYHCYNTAVLNVDTCQCTCVNTFNQAFYAGKPCALNCTNIGTPFCGYSTMAGWSTQWCEDYFNVPYECPVQCGWCPEADSTSYLTTAASPTTSTSSTTTSTAAMSPPSSTVSPGSSTNGTTEGAGGGGRGACLVLNINLIVFFTALVTCISFYDAV